MVEPLQIYKHFKGNLYQIICVAENSETGKAEVVYRALYGDCKIYARDLDMFLSAVDKQKYPEVSQEKRFELVTFSDATIKSETVVTENETTPVSETELAAETKTEIEAVEENTDTETEPESNVVTEETGSKPQINPVLLKFLEANGYAEQLEVLSEIREELTEEILIPIELSLGMEEQHGDVDKRYRNIKNHICLKQRYEKTSR